MNQFELEQAIEKMTEQEIEAMLATEIPEELEKQAAAEVAEGDFMNSLFAYGMLTADLEVSATEAGEAGLSKEASAEFAQAEQEISAAIEAGVGELALDQIEDTVELHKTAMVAAGVIFEGYCAQLQKLAEGEAGAAAQPGKLKAAYETVKGHAMKAGAKAQEHAKHLSGKAREMAGKHGKGALAGLAVGSALGYAAKRHMDKKASELTVSEMTAAVLEQSEVIDFVIDGVEKLAAEGEVKAKMFHKALARGKELYGKSGIAGKGKHMAGAAAAGGLAGVIAGRMSKKDKKK